MKDKKTIGTIIKKYRTEHGISMDDFAKKSGLSKGYISMLEKNYNPKTKREIVPTTRTVEGVAKAMGLEPHMVYQMISDNVELSKEKQSKIFEEVKRRAALSGVKMPSQWKELSHIVEAISDFNEKYYTDQEAAEYAEELRTNPNMKVLFSAAKDISKEQIEDTVKYIEFLKSKEKPVDIEDIVDDNFIE